MSASSATKSVERLHGRHEEWRVSRSDYPEAAPLADRLRYLIRYAVLSPSHLNTQPWLFHIDATADGRIDILADRRRRCRVADPNDRELTISCGCALYALRVALRRFGMCDCVCLLPDASNRDLLASIHINGGCKPTDEDVMLFKAIPQRRTSRHPFSHDPIPDGMIAKWDRDASAESACLVAIADSQTRHAIADLMAEGDRIHMHDDKYRHELAYWTRNNTDARRDGLPSYALNHFHGMWEFLSRFEPAIIRNFDMGKSFAAQARQLALDSPLLGVLCTRHDEPVDWLHAGQAVMRIALRAQSSGVWTGFLNQPVEIPSLREQLRKTLGHGGYPQMVIRMGHGPAVEPTPRRPIEEVLV
jgi:hypothetical protein